MPSPLQGALQPLQGALQGPEVGQEVGPEVGTEVGRGVRRGEGRVVGRGPGRGEVIQASLMWELGWRARRGGVEEVWRGVRHCCVTVSHGG